MDKNNNRLQMVYVLAGTERDIYLEQGGGRWGGSISYKHLFQEGMKWES